MSDTIDPALLRPCPFCGCAPSVFQAFTKTAGRKIPEIQILCINPACPVRVELVAPSAETGQLLWNMRQSPRREGPQS